MRWIVGTAAVCLVIALAGAAGALWVLRAYGQGLPDYRQLADYRPAVLTRVHASDGRLVIEYATEQRIFVPISAVPGLVIGAVLAAEDKDFYSHPGVDFVSLAAAMVQNLRNYATGRRLRGASTITQQVAKNFLLTSEVTVERKIKEAILAFRIERVLGKDQILELYLNQIYFGRGSHGIAAAALNYFNKALSELDVEEAAYLAALPKAPNNYHPERQHEKAVWRRNWVLERMAEDGVITDALAAEARERPLVVRHREATETAVATYFAEEVRRQLLTRYGEDDLYRGGLSVRTSLDWRLQRIADAALREGLELYDRRHGWRGALGRIETGPDWRERLLEFGPQPGMRTTWQVAVVLAANADAARIGLPDGETGLLALEELRWARRTRKGQRLGPRVESVDHVLSTGDVILVEVLAELVEPDGFEDVPPILSYGLRQVPDVNGALVALDPHTGRVLAMSGGWDFSVSNFNRATQAWRQPGSAFKPFVYLAALEQGYTPTTVILDAPFVLDLGPGRRKWKPANYSRKFYGPSAMRLGIEKSRNLMTVRLAQAIGMERVAEAAHRFGIVDDMPEHLAMALGSGETTLLRLTAAYGTLVNGGYRVTPTLIDRIQDRNGRNVYRSDTRVCPGCMGTDAGPVPRVPERAERVVDSASVYQMVRMLEGVVQRGTGRRISELGRPLAGKTGTSNENVDAWFIGFSPDLVVGTFVGFDTPRTLGPSDTGSRVAVPIFKEFMAEALTGTLPVPFRAPSGILHVRINPETGELAQAGDRSVIIEAFKPGQQPVPGQANGEIVSGPVDGSDHGLY
ncbi:MAG: penicillin-binding protein 1A [Alphaproteobacteria bacterium]|nr:penicillin-binding protein 1A [Alphaproteobacteria bacterium]